MGAPKKFDTLTLIIAASLAALDAYAWLLIVQGRVPAASRAYFLDVGQGDSELFVLSGGVKIMFDAGPGSKVVEALQGAAVPGGRYIDLAVVTHPDTDHFAGYLDLLDRYEIGAMVYSGRDAPSDAGKWQELIEKIKKKRTPLITVGALDRIHYRNDTVYILSPTPEFARSAATNDVSVVALADIGGFRTLLVADAGFAIEDDLLSRMRPFLRADVLKVAHHGSKYASGAAFLRAVSPAIAAIGVGAGNTYGHPAKETLARIAAETSARVFRTDLAGTIEVSRDGENLKISTAR